MAVDFSGSRGERALGHLRSDLVVWLTTAGAAGQPNPNPVWFLWRAGRVLVLSQPGSARLATLAINPRVALNFETGADQNDVVVFNAIATVRPANDPLDPADRAQYLAKYGSSIEAIGYTPDQMLGSYSVPIELELTKLRGL